MISEEQMKLAREIREWVGPMRRPDGRIDASAVAREATLRHTYGLPSWIAELDAPKDGLDQMEGQEDQAREPDTMPAQGWAAAGWWFSEGVAAAMRAEITDAGRLPAPRKDSTMAPVEIGQAEMRMDYGHAAERGEMIDHLTGLPPDKLVEELEQRPVRDLRELHHQAAGTEAWHQQGMNDARDLSRTIGQLLRAVGDEIDPQAKTEAQSMGTLR